MDKVPAIQVGGLEGGGAQHQPLASFTVVCVRERETFPSLCVAVVIYPQQEETK